jgi:hypothetical protein
MKPKWHFILIACLSVLLLCSVVAWAKSYGEDDLKAAFASGYASGSMEGEEIYTGYNYDRGYENGYYDGYEDGYAKGENWGQDTGYQAGYENGFWAGEEEASKDYAIIAEDNYAQGYIEGYEDAKAGKPSIYD